MSVNKVIAIGRLVKEFKLEYLPNGTAAGKMTIAVNEKYKDKTGSMKEQVEYINVAVFGKLGELCSKYLSKSSQCYIEGKLRTRSWDDSKTGEKKYFTEVLADKVQFLDAKSSTDSPVSAPAKQEEKYVDPFAQEYKIVSDSSFTADEIGW